MTSVIKRTDPVVQASDTGVSALKDLLKQGEYVLVPANPSGTATARIVLSALPDTRRFDLGLNLSTVDGKSCALRTESRGWREFQC